ncbi:MAG: hypothetical protein H0Z28_12025 [Archaeoglobus sp.]|nr:hypothetical protein [Archaeoglobus sp.]
MRLKINKDTISIIIKERLSIYTDWKTNEELKKKNIFVKPFYDENKDLAELRIPKEFSIQEIDEIYIPDKLPRRNYFFIFGGTKTLPIYSADSFTELDPLLFEDRLIVYRVDCGEMSKPEIYALRREFFDVLKYLDHILIFESVESVYMNGKLYFWKENTSLYPENFEDLIDRAVEMLRKNNYEVTTIIDDEIGGIIVAKTLFSTKAFMFLESEESKSNSGEKKSIAFGDSESFTALSDPELYTKISWLSNEVEKIEKYFGKFDEVVLVYEWDLGDTKNLLRKKRIKIKSTLEFISDFLFAKSELNDEDATKNKETWNTFIESKFGK